MPISSKYLENLRYKSKKYHRTSNLKFSNYQQLTRKFTRAHFQRLKSKKWNGVDDKLDISSLSLFRLLYDNSFNVICYLTNLNSGIANIKLNNFGDEGFRGGSRAAATSKMKYFVTIVKGWKPLTIITKRSILDVTATLDPPLGLV